MKSVALDWLRQARDELNAASDFLSDKGLTYLVAFHSRQCVEYCFKALAESHVREITDTHHLIHLAKFIKPFPMEMDMDLLIKLNGFDADAVNPGKVKVMPDGMPTLQEAARFRDFAQEVFKISLEICKDENNWDSSFWNFLMWP